MDANDLVYLRARYYHPGLGVFTSLDPVEGVNRYQYVGANPTNMVDPSGMIYESPTMWDGCYRMGEEDCSKYLISFGFNQHYLDCMNRNRQIWGFNPLDLIHGSELRQFQIYADCLLTVPTITDLERLALLSDFVASEYPNKKQYLDTMSRIILGVPSGILAAGWAVLKGTCAGWGRDPFDCPENERDLLFLTDTGFHPDLQDRHNQVYHFWASVAGVGSADSSTDADWHYIVNFAGLQVFHEITQGKILKSDGASWPDFALTDKGLLLGELLATGEVLPEDAGDWMRGHLRSGHSLIDGLQEAFSLPGHETDNDWYERREQYLQSLTTDPNTMTTEGCRSRAMN